MYRKEKNRDALPGVSTDSDLPVGFYIFQLVLRGTGDAEEIQLLTVILKEDENNMTSLSLINTGRKTGKEKFRTGNKAYDFTVLDFWQWSASNLISNAQRGVLAEYIVAQALGIANSIRNEWDPYDLIIDNKIKIEVKSASYIQSWEQENYSKIIFDIRPTRDFDEYAINSDAECKRRSNVYIFCLLAHKDQETLNPLNLEQWKFYILLTSILDQKLHNQKTITLSSLTKINPIKSNFEDMRSK